MLCPRIPALVEARSAGKMSRERGKGDRGNPPNQKIRGKSANRREVVFSLGLGFARADDDELFEQRPFHVEPLASSACTSAARCAFLCCGASALILPRAGSVRVGTSRRPPTFGLGLEGGVTRYF